MSRTICQAPNAVSKKEKAGGAIPTKSALVKRNVGMAADANTQCHAIGNV
jgi:hypothetical protein